MVKISLNGTWSMKNCKTNKAIDATVPGSDFGNLIKAGVIKNPLISGIEEEALKTAEDDFEWSRIFTVDKKALEYDNVHLTCPCLDTLCTCTINGKVAFKSYNSYTPVDKDVKEFLVAGENSISIHFDSPYIYIKEKQKKEALPKNFNGVDGIPYIRKPGCHFGWDWGPCVPYSGILGDIDIVSFNKRIENVRIDQSTSKELSTVTASATNADKIYMLTPAGDKLETTDGKFTIENPELWYTKDLSEKDEQPLYTVVFENDEDRIEKKIGLRSLRLCQDADEYGNNFCFEINGERIFSKGANLIPFSAIYEDSSKEDVDYYLQLAEDSNFNIIRVWGGGSYADDYLISECDRRGILVWQDFMFACQLYPLYDDELVNNILEEVNANVSRLTTHPSLAVWCGNNEIETMFSYMPKTTKLMKAYHEFFYSTLPNALKNLTDVDYIPTSPIGNGFLKNISSDNYGDTHMWNVWHGLKKLDYYQERFSRFLSEFGLESLPSMRAIKTFAKPDEYEITSPSFNAHQKCVGGNKKMLFYLTEMFDFPKHFEALPYLTGIVQAECIKNATVHFRQNKGRCNGSIFWQFNDVWNCPSWSSVDFEKVPKALQYKAKEFFAPVTVSCKKQKGTAYIYAHNDTLFTKKIDATLGIYDLNGKKLKDESYQIELAPNSFKKIKEFKYDKNTVLKIDFNGKSLIEIFDAPSKLKLPNVNISTSLDGNKLNVKSDKFAYNIFVDADEIPKENYFSLVAGEEKTIEFDKAPSEYSVMCANNIEFKKNKLKKAWFRFTYRLKPENIANFVYYSRT